MLSLPQRHELGVVGRQHEALAAAGRPGGERAALEQGHLGARLGQVPGRRRPDHAAPDHDHVRHAAEPTVPAALRPISGHMETVLPLAGAGFALGWPIEWLIQRFPSGEGTAPSSPPPLDRRRGHRGAVRGRDAQDRLPRPARPGAAPDRADRAGLGHRPAPPHHPERDQPARRGRGVPDRGHRPARPLGRASDRRRRRGALPRRRLAGLSGRDGPRRREDDADDRAGARQATPASPSSPRSRSRSCRRSPCSCSKGPRGRKVSFPFGPFLALGAMVAILWGPQLWAAWYVG